MTDREVGRSWTAHRVALAGMALLVASTTFGEEWELLPAEVLNRTGNYDSLAEDRGERVLFIKQKINAKDITYLVIGEYTSVAKSVEAFLLQSFGVENVEETESLSQWKTNRSKGSPGEAHGSDPRRGQFRQRHFTTQPLKAISNAGAYSKILVRVVEAQAIFGGRCTAITMTREDNTREWTRFAHIPIPLPFKMDNKIFLITETEMDVATKLMRALGLPANGPILRDEMLALFPKDWYSSMEGLQRLNDVIELQCYGKLD